MRATGCEPEEESSVADGVVDSTTSATRTAVLAGLVATAVLCNTLCPTLFWNAVSSEFVQDAAFAAMGGLVAEVCLLAIWLALATLSLKYRLPITTALVLVVVCSFCLGLQLPGDELPMEPALLFMAVAFVLFATLQLPLWYMRRLTGDRITVEGHSMPSARATDSQFNVRYLLICTAAVSILLALAKYTFPNRWAGGGIPARDVVPVISAGLIYWVFTATLSIPCAWVVLSERGRAGGAICLGAVWLVAPVMAPLAVNTVLGIRGMQAREILIGNYCYATGVIWTTLLVFVVLRNAGYRLVRMDTA